MILNYIKDHFRPFPVDARQYPLRWRLGGDSYATVPDMPVFKLTRRAVSALKPGKSPVAYYDSDLPGFGLRLRPTGAASWFVEYRPGAGGRAVAKRRIVIGTLATLSPEKARAEAERLLAVVKLGGDPAAERTAARQAETVNDLLDVFITNHLKAKRKIGTVRLNTGYIENHIRPALGRKAANAVTVADIGRLHRSIGKAYPVTANRVISLLGTIYAHAIKTGALPDDIKNPAAGIEPFREQARERFLTGDELQRLGDAIHEAETVGIPWEPDPGKKVKHAPKPENRRTKIDQFAAAALRLLLFTGCRLREILNLRWSEVDAERGVLFLPDSKTGRKTVVLSTAAMEVLSALPRLGTYVIAGESAGRADERPRSDLNKPWRSVRKRAGLDGVRLHDLRHSFASVGAGAGLGLPVIGKLLGHSQASTTQRYAHLDVDPVRRAADIIAGKIAEAINRK